LSEGAHAKHPFELLIPDQRGPERREALADRTLPATLGNLREAARHYQPDADLVDAINVALAVGAPLLLTGEPGTGKTPVGHYLAWYFDIEEQFFPLLVRSTTTAEDLLYRYEAGGPSVVLIDEIDKAPRDFPNDLLNVIDQHEFVVPESNNRRVSRGDKPPPIVVITSNSERRLPEPFLRRCIFHHIAFTEELVRRAVEARLGDFPHLPEAVRDTAIERFLELRGREIRKKTATAELLVWLTVLAARGTVTEADVREPRLADLPAISTLIKDRDDLAILQ
jgi:MoxR-like ATPase